jgi:signal transduction histidine kinase
MWGVPQDIVDSRSDELALAWVLRTLQDPDAFLARVAYLYQHPDEESRDLIPLKDGRTFDRYSAPVKSRDGVYYGRVWFFRDVTELKRAEAELARLYQEAQEAIRVRDEFLSIASHELRTPLTSLQLQIQGIQRKLGRTTDTGVSTPWITERITSAFDLVAGLSRLIGNLLDISRITSRRIVLEDEGFDLSAMVTEVVHRHAEQFADAGCTVRIHAADPLPGRWDRMRLDQVLTNLLTNASKYGRGAPVDIAVGGDGPTVWITVRDQGIGIDPKDRERIFLRFERAVSSNHYGGFGLGLWIVREIVGLMGGDITVQSAPGQGAEFRVTLPLRRHLPAEAAEGSP